MSNKCKNTDPCKNCTPKQRYCGDELTCLGVVKGEKYDDIFKKINDIICDGIGNQYEFEEDEECENGGFNVYQVNGEDRVLIFNTCYPCCEKDIEMYLWTDGDTPNSTTSWIKSNSIVGRNAPTINITETGKYRITYEQYYFTDDPQAEFIVGIGKNGASPAVPLILEKNTKVTKWHRLRDDSGSLDVMATFLIDLVNGDTIDLWIKGLTNSNNTDSFGRLTVEKM